jgi:hypothetical protein
MVKRTAVPSLYLDNKHPDVEATRGDDFHYSWVLDDGKTLTVEYIPENYPSLTVTIDNDTPEELKATLRKLRFDVVDE